MSIEMNQIPKSITESSLNESSSVGHTHAIDKASTTQAGIVKLVDNLESKSKTEALTANQGRELAKRLSLLAQSNGSKEINERLESALSYLATRYTAAYATYKTAKDNVCKHPENSLIYVVNDPTKGNNGLWTIIGGRLVKAPWDTLSSALTSETFEVFQSILQGAAGEQIEYRGKVYDTPATVTQTLAEGRNYIRDVLIDLAQSNNFTASYLLTASGKFQEEINDLTGAPYRVKVGGYRIGERVVLVNGQIVQNTIAGNIVNPNVDMTGWVGGTDASFVVDGDKTQKQINDANVAMIDTFPSVSAALDWVKSNVNNYLYVKAGTTYTLPTGTVYFNRIVCLSGQATFKVPATTVLNYIDKTDGSEVVHLENLNILVSGHRGNVTAANIEDMVFPYSQGNTAVKSSLIRNLNIKSLTNIDDVNSWSDDAGQSRCVGFINLLVNESSIIENVQHYGLGTFAVVKSNNSNAVHYERNVVGYNNETNIYNPVSTFKIGESSNIKIFNTSAQKIYWLKKNAGTLTNGKNCVMCESDHTDSHLIEKCGGKNILERSVYNTSRNTIMIDTLDEDSATCAAMKHTKTSTPSGEAYADGLRAYNITNTSAILDVYGFSKYTLKNFQLKNITKTSARAIYFTNVGDVELKGGSIKNLGMPFYLVGTQNVGSVDISDYEIINCNNAAEGSLWWRRSDATNTLQKLTMSNIKYKIENIIVAELANVGAAFEGVVSVKLNNVECISRQSPFIKGAATTYIEALDCNFRVVSNATYLNMWTALGGTYAPYANKFDYTVLIESTVAAPQVAIKARFQKLFDSGLVKCHDHWKQVDIGYEVATATGVQLMTIGDKSFKCIASFGQSQMEFVWDAVTRAVTTSYNVGGVLSPTLASDKINIYVDSLNRFTINIGNGTWTGGTGNLSVKISRF